MKTAKSNPELIVIGAKCKILLPSNWIGATNTTEPNVWLPAKITNIYMDKNDPSKMSAVILDVRASHKYNTVRIKSMMSLCTQFETIKF